MCEFLLWEQESKLFPNGEEAAGISKSHFNLHTESSDCYVNLEPEEMSCGHPQFSACSG